MTDLRGRVDLREVELPTSPSAYPSVPTDFSLELGSTQRTFVFCARSATELQEWLCHLRAQIARARAASSPAAAAYAASLGFRLGLGVGVGLGIALTLPLTLTLALTLALTQVRSALLSGVERERCYP